MIGRSPHAIQGLLMKKIALLLAVISLSFFCSQAQVRSPAAPPPTLRYTFLTAGNKAGFESSTRNADGSVQIHYEFNDRGRGPSINERIVIDKYGIPVEIENTGVDYFKAPVEEHYSFKQGKASWKNRAEEGQKQAALRTFYVSVSGATEEAAFLAQALLVTSGHKLPLLP